MSIDTDYEDQMAHLQKKVDKGDKLEILMNTPGFRELILEDYLEQRPIGLTQQLCLAPRPEVKEGMVTELTAVSCFNAYLNDVRNEASHARDTLKAYQEEMAYNSGVAL